MASQRKTETADGYDNSENEPEDMTKGNISLQEIMFLFFLLKNCCFP